jgi:hypothetical protein
VCLQDDTSSHRPTLNPASRPRSTPTDLTLLFFSFQATARSSPALSPSLGQPVPGETACESAQSREGTRWPLKQPNSRSSDQPSNRLTGRAKSGITIQTQEVVCGAVGLDNSRFFFDMCDRHGTRRVK